MSARKRGVDERCPKERRQNAVLTADFHCQLTLLCDQFFRVLVPDYPSDVMPDVQRLIPLTNVLMPWGRGRFARYRATRYLNVAYVWACERDVHTCYTIDRFRPASAGGLYGWNNIGVLCSTDQQFKRQHWPWLDYRPTSYKQRMAAYEEAYLARQYGRQLWLWEDF